MKWLCSWVLLSNCLFFTEVAHGQAVQALGPDWSEVIHQEPRVNTSVLVVGSAVGWAAGLVTGAGIGYLVEPNTGDSWVGAKEWWVGAWLGSSLGAAAGAHMANGSRGNLLHGAIGSLLVVPALAIVTLPIGGAGAVLAPVVQVGLTVSIERTSGESAKN